MSCWISCKCELPTRENHSFVGLHTVCSTVCKLWIYKCKHLHFYCYKKSNSTHEKSAAFCLWLIIKDNFVMWVFPTRSNSGDKMSLCSFTSSECFVSARTHHLSLCPLTQTASVMWHSQIICAVFGFSLKEYLCFRIRNSFLFKSMHSCRWHTLKTLTSCTDRSWNHECFHKIGSYISLLGLL